jgi:hypothetical protein
LYEDQSTDQTGPRNLYPLMYRVAVGLRKLHREDCGLPRYDVWNGSSWKSEAFPLRFPFQTEACLLGSISLSNPRIANRLRTLYETGAVRTYSTGIQTLPWMILMVIHLVPPAVPAAWVQFRCPVDLTGPGFGFPHSLLHSAEGLL